MSFLKKKRSSFEMGCCITRKERIKNLYHPESLYAKTWISNIIVLFAVLIDFYCLKVIWNLVQTESAFFSYCMAFACALALDVPLAIAAISLKKYHQNLCSKREKNLIMILSIAVFLIAFVFSLGFRIVTKNLSFDIGSVSTLVNTMATANVEADTGDLEIGFAAMFNGVIPLLTSIASFVLSYFSSNPLMMKLSKLERERVSIQANISEIEQALIQAGEPEEHFVKLIAREEELYEKFISKLDAESISLKQIVRVIIMEKLSTPEGVTSMSQSGEDLCNGIGKYHEKGQEFATIVEKQLENKEETKSFVDSYIA